jgi:hypothetical protein
VIAATMMLDGVEVPLPAGLEASLPSVAATPRFVPVAIIRERVTAAGLWVAFATALDMLPAEKRWHLLTLREGVASDDADAIALLSAIGADPDSVLAP